MDQYACIIMFLIFIQIILDMERVLQTERLQATVRNSWLKVWTPQIWLQLICDTKKTSLLMSTLDFDEGIKLYIFKVLTM